MVVKTVVEAQDIFDKAWEGFKGEDWKEKASVSRFVQANYTPYDGDESFLAGPTERSLHIKKIVEDVNEIKGRLWLSDYSKELFASYDVNMMPLEEFDLTKANDNDVVYVENVDVDLEAMIADKEVSIELNFYRWDKVYPSDKKMIFTKELLDAFFVKASYELSGETHDVISVEIWEKTKK